MGEGIQLSSWPDSIRFGWALIYFLWQGLLIAIVLEIVLACVSQKNAVMRHLLCGLALAAMPVCLLATYEALDLGTSATLSAPTSLPLVVHAHASSSIESAGSAQPPVVQMIGSYTTREFSTLELNRFMPGIVAGWIAGVLLLSGRKAGGFLVLWRLRRRGVFAPDNALAELFQKACDKIGVDPRRVFLKISTLIQVPMTMGWINPIVLFPATLLSGLSTGEIELILAHELAHIRRHDYLVNLLQTVVETLFFYHPVTWWISRRMRQERENRCDDLVASCSGEALAYAKVLLRLQTLGTPDAMLATAVNGGSLLQRIRRLLGEPAPKTGMGLPTLLALLSIIGVIGVTSVVKAQGAAPGKAPEVVPSFAPMAKAVPPTPEPAFALPITVKETRNGTRIDRLYYQGGVILLQQEIGGSPGSIGQLVFYQGAIIVDDRKGNGTLAYSSRTIDTNNFKIQVQSLAADSVSPARLRVLDPSEEIISEFFIDQTGVMRPITKAEHDADLARRKAFNAAAPAMTPAEAKGDGVAAVVNGHPILKTMVEQQCAETEKLLKQNLSGNELNQKIEDARANVLKALIDRELILEDFRLRQGGFIPKEFVDERIDDIVKDEYGGDRNAFLKTIATRGVTLEKCREDIENNAIVGYMRNKNVATKVWQYYQDHLDLFPQDEQINVTLITIWAEGTTNVSNHSNAKYALAQQVLDQLKKGGDFSALVKKYNQDFDHDPNRWVTKDGPSSLYSSSAWDAVEKLQSGQTSDILESDGSGWFYAIARVNERRPAKITATGETTKQKEVIINTEAKRIEEAWLASLRAKAQIQTFGQGNQTTE